MVRATSSIKRQCFGGKNGSEACLAGDIYIYLYFKRGLQVYMYVLRIPGVRCVGIKPLKRRVWCVVELNNRGMYAWSESVVQRSTSTDDEKAEKKKGAAASKAPSGACIDTCAVLKLLLKYVAAMPSVCLCCVCTYALEDPAPAREELVVELQQMGVQTTEQ